MVEWFNRLKENKLAEISLVSGLLTIITSIVSLVIASFTFIISINNGKMDSIYDIGKNIFGIGFVILIWSFTVMITMLFCGWIHLLAKNTNLWYKIALYLVAIAVIISAVGWIIALTPEMYIVGLSLI